MAFTGFTTDALVGLPVEFFTEVLPQITLPSELKVTLHVFYRLSRQRGPSPRRISWDELAADQMLQRGLRAITRLRPTEELLAEGLDAAVRRTTLLHVALPDGARSVNWYVVNTAANRAWVERVRQAGATLTPNPPPSDDRPSLITLYEQNIGLVTPMLLADLQEAEERYPAHWIEEAIREAVHANVRSWRYVKKILERWATNGRNDAQDRTDRPIDVEKYTSGAYGDLFRRGSDVSDLQ